MKRLCVIFLICVAAGCSGEEQHPAQKALSKSDYEALKREFSQPSGGVVQRGATYPITRGPLPLAYIVTGDSMVRVMDMTNGALVGSGEAPASSVVAVDARGGVTIADENVTPGPLASGHEYGIYVEGPAAPGAKMQTGARVPPATLPAKK